MSWLTVRKGLLGLRIAETVFVVASLLLHASDEGLSRDTSLQIDQDSDNEQGSSSQSEGLEI